MRVAGFLFSPRGEKTERFLTQSLVCPPFESASARGTQGLIDQLLVEL